MKLLFAFFTLTLVSAISAWSQDQRAKQAIPAKGYHVILHSPDPRFGGTRILGRIPDSENMEIHAEANAITSEKSVTLTGKAVVTVSINGRAMATYEGEELVLTPIVIAAEPLNHQEVSAKLKEFDAAGARRDSKAIAGFFSEDAKITVESLTTTGVQTKSYSREEYADHLKGIFPNALRISVEDYFTDQVRGNDDEQPGYQMAVSKDGISATGKHNVRYVIVLAEGQIYWRVNRKLAVEKRGPAFVITSMEVTLPKSLKENWPEAKVDQFGGPPRPPIIRTR